MSHVTKVFNSLYRVCLFVGLIQYPANSSMSSFQTAQGNAFRKLFYAAGAVTASMRRGAYL